MSTSRDRVLEVRDLSVEYRGRSGAAHAVDGVNLVLHRGEVLGLAGESGCGKSTLAYALTRLLRPPGVITSGQVLYHEPAGGARDILRLSDEELRAVRWDQIAIVFQSAMNALNPVLTVRAQLADIFAAHRPDMDKIERGARVEELLSVVGIAPERARAFPHELSGGMRQRVMIAMAVALKPSVVIMDEPTTALDVVMQRRILMEMMKLRDRFGFSVVFITHDLSLLVELADVIAVMYAGKVVEQCEAAELYRSPRHPYSQGLLNSFPRLRGPRKELMGIAGTPPDPKALPAGCAFHPRCPHMRPECMSRCPDLLESPLVGDGPGHLVSCLLYTGGESGPPPETLTGGVSHVR